MQESIFYTELRWPELQEMAEQRAIVLLPLGQVEEHGPHAPVGTDMFIAAETARRVAEAASAETPVLVMPPVWAGYSGRGLFKWPGAISVPTDAMIAILENIVLSLYRSGFRAVVIMNSHGHHEGIARVVARRVADQVKMTLVVSHIWRMAEDVVQKVRESEDGGCNHSGEYETSLMLAYDKRVDMDACRDEPVRPQSRYVGGDLITRHSAKVFWSTWGHTNSETGTYGSPSFATREKGLQISEETVQAYVDLLRDIRKSELARQAP